MGKRMQLIILGAGGHGQVVADIARQTRRYDQIYFLDDHAEKNDVIGSCVEYLRFKEADTEMYPAFGNNEVRIEWENRLLKAGILLAKIIHPLAYISPLAEIAEGCVVMPYAIVNTGTRVKKACIINIGAMVDHDCILEEGCHLAPGAIVKAINHLPEGTKVDSGEVIPLQFYKIEK